MAALSNADKEAYGQVYNVGSGVNYSVNEVAEMISNSVKSVSYTHLTLPTNREV